MALKVIQAPRAGSPEGCRRFEREYEVTGRLEHPGIAPVYAAGRCDDGRPYYVMRFIDGETFKDAVHGFYAAHPAAQHSGERVLGFRGLLNRLVQVCHTIDYAHSRGILHRDIKPSNVMLGPYGETLVVDWGLAKVIREPGEGRQDGGQAESAGLAPAVVGSPSGNPTLEGDQGTIDYSHNRDASQGDVQVGRQLRPARTARRWTSAGAWPPPRGQ